MTPKAKILSEQEVYMYLERRLKVVLKFNFRTYFKDKLFSKS